MSRAPRDARYRANAFPIPEDAPVTQIVFPLTFMDDYQFSSWGYGVIWGHSTFISLRSVKFFRILENWKTISNKCAILICRKRGNGMARPKNESVILRVKHYQKATYARYKTEAQAILHKYVPQEYDYTERGKAGFSNYGSSNEYLDALSHRNAAALCSIHECPDYQVKH